MSSIIDPHEQSSERPQRTRYDSVVVMNRLHNPELIDMAAIGGVWQIYNIAEKELSDAELYVLSATHFYPHTHKKSIRTLAAELGSTEKTVQSYIESAKKIINGRLKETASDHVGHPLLRVRVYPQTDGCDSALPCAPFAQDESTDDFCAQSLDRMASLLFDTNTYFAVSSYFLRGSDLRLNAGQIAQALNISASGAHQKIYEARNVLKQACGYQMQKSKFLSHPMFTGEDPHYSTRRLAALDEDRYIGLGSVSAHVLFKEAEALPAHYRLPLLRTHFYAATEKHSIERVAKDLRLAVTSVEEYILRGRAELRQIIADKYPILEDHPILRPKRRYQNEAESRRQFDFLDMPIVSKLSDEDKLRLKWASILLNRQHYYVFAWSLGIKEGGLKQAFRDNTTLKNFVTYAGIYVSVRTAKELCDKAQALEVQFIAEQSCASSVGARELSNVIS